jgi:hypothetical protein
MPLKVPGGQANMPIPLMKGEQPSEVDYAMALATMKRLDRIPTFDERFRGQDPASLPVDVRQKGQAVRGIGKEDLRAMKQNWINKGTADQGRKMDLPGTEDQMPNLGSR